MEMNLLIHARYQDVRGKFTLQAYHTTNHPEDFTQYVRMDVGNTMANALKQARDIIQKLPATGDVLHAVCAIDAALTTFSIADAAIARATQTQEV